MHTKHSRHLRIIKDEKLRLSLLFIISLIFFQPFDLQAQMRPTCDENYLQVLDRKAWLEGKRQLEAAQKIILKPDSTLEYSCFYVRVDELGRGPNWSDGAPVDNGGIFDNVVSSPGNLSAALGRVVNLPMNDYLGNNFYHTMGGGSSGIGTLSCSIMNSIWTFLKCHNQNVDDFMTLQELAGADQRTLPQPCTAIETTRAQNWNEALQVAYPAPSSPPQAGSVETQNNYLERLNPANCSENYQAIPTGVPTYAEGVSYTEHVCIAPGCTYDPVAGRCF